MTTKMLVLFMAFIFECSGCALITNIKEVMPRHQYELFASYRTLAFNSYFPQKERKIVTNKRYCFYTELLNESKIIKLRSGLAIGINFGIIPLVEVDMKKLSLNFFNSLKTQTSFITSYDIPKSEAEKLALIASRKISWEEGLALLKSVHGTSKDTLQAMSFEDALFTVFLRIERPPENISMISRIFGSNQEKERLQRELENDRKLFDSYMDAAIKCCEERMGCTDSDLEKIYYDYIQSKKKDGKQD